MLTAEIILAGLSQMESKTVLLEMNCQEIISLSNKYSEKQISLAKQMLTFTEGARKTCNELFEILKDEYNRVQPPLWISVKVASDAWLKEINQMNIIAEGIIEDTYVNYIKDSKGNIVGVEGTKINYDTYMKNKDKKTGWKTFLKNLFNPFDL